MPPPTYQHDIFLSYASEDQNRIVNLVKALEKLGWRVWWDQHIPPGREFDEFIEEQLEGSKSVLVVWSATSVKKRWVRNEAREGLRLKVLFPVKIDEVKIPIEFNSVQAANLIHWGTEVQKTQWRNLVASLSTVLGSSLNPPEPTSPVPNEPSKGMVLIPKGPFLYGDKRKKVHIDHDYYMDIHPVTNAAYRKFIEVGGYYKQSHWSEEGWKWRTKKKITNPDYWDDEAFNRPDQPVVGVSYCEAEAYANWAGKRLPTEREWEKAARGTDGRNYPWGEELDATKCACSVETRRTSTAAVGSYPEGKSPYGCYDMAGNGWEWCASWYDADRDTRVLRGGSWDNLNPVYFRCAYRFNIDPRIRSFNIGFRCVQDAP